jgi:hypothetical protein
MWLTVTGLVFMSSVTHGALFTRSSQQSMVAPKGRLLEIHRIMETRSSLWTYSTVVEPSRALIRNSHVLAIIHINLFNPGKHKTHPLGLVVAWFSIPLPRLRLERQMVGGEDCLSAESASSAAAPDAALRPKDEAAAG